MTVTARLPPMSLTLLGVGGVSVLGFGLYVFGYIFHAGAVPGKNLEQDKFVQETCNPNEGILGTVLTWGYCKATWRRFRVDLGAWWRREVKANEGSKSPDATLVKLDGTKRQLVADYVGKMPSGMPLILNLGGKDAPAAMLTIYIEEAHAKDEWYFHESKVTTEFQTEIATHKSIDDRLAAAAHFRDKTKVHDLEIVCDSMEGHMVTRYGAWPERLYIIVDGVVVYKGGMGPFDYRLYEVREWLERRFPDRK